MRSLSLSALSFLGTAVRTVGTCVFCNKERTYDLSAVPTATFTAHSTPGTKSSRTYYITNPCASASSVACVAGPTSDPVATVAPGHLGACKGWGSLNDTKAPDVRGDASGVNITIHGGIGHKSVLYRMVCDPAAPAGNPPERRVAAHGAASVVVTWRHPSACGVPTPAGGCVRPAPPAPPPPPCEACLPPWRPTWDMQRSTALYACNASDFHDVEEAVKFGIAVYDWSNAKHLWVNAHPMSDQELLTEQCERVLAADPSVPGEQPRCWVYRNKIKALNWYSSVRVKLDDPRYAGWFVKFKDYQGRSSNNSYMVPACDWYGTPDDPPKCSGFYHDQGQAPTRLGAGPKYQRPSCVHDAAGHSTHDCVNTCDEAQCDCGPTNPCGEYTFDHRNESFSDWYINDYMITNDTLLHDPPINLGWMDDRISVTSGMSEPGHPADWVADTGSSPEDMQNHVDAFELNVGRLQKAVVEKGGFYWQMIQGDGPEVRSIADGDEHKGCNQPRPRNVTAEQCQSTLREWCTPGATNPAERIAHKYLVCPGREGSNTGMQSKETAESATAEFLLTRGPYAWIGYGWSGCAHGDRYPFGGSRVPYPEQWTRDYGGAPKGLCAETGAGTGVFEREYPKATVRWDCNKGSGKISMKE